MRVLLVNLLVDPVVGGGTAERTFQLARSLASQGVSVTVLTLDIEPADRREDVLHNVRCIALPCLNRRYFIPRVSARWLRELLRSIDVVHLMNHWTLLNALVYRAVRSSAVPYVVCPAGALTLFGRSRRLKRLYNAVVGRKLIANADACVAISPNEIPVMRSYGARPERIVVIPNGVNPSDYQSDDVDGFRRKFELPDTPLVVFLGRLTPIKGPDLLLDAFLSALAGENQYHLVFVGLDGGLLDALRSRAEASGIADRIHFVGPLHGDAKAQALHAATLLAVPSRQEAMSIVVLEAGVCATPVLITDACGFDEIQSRGCGKVVPATVDGLSRGLTELLRDPEALADTGRRNEQFTREGFLWERIADRYLQLFRSTIDPGPVHAPGEQPR